AEARQPVSAGHVLCGRQWTAGGARGEQRDEEPHPRLHQRTEVSRGRVGNYDDAGGWRRGWIGGCECSATAQAAGGAGALTKTRVGSQESAFPDSRLLTTDSCLYVSIPT